MKKKFKIIDASSGEKIKLEDGEMLVMNGAGVFFLVTGMGEYYTGIRKLSEVYPKYDVIWS